mgnify:CR=1 FL=1
MSKVKTVSVDQEASLRKQIFDYAISQADGPYREFVSRLFQAWKEFNDLYFDGSLTPAYIAITSPEAPAALADCGVWSSYGGKHQIRIREKVVNGKYRRFNQNHSIENRWLYILDILLHEQAHQFVHEVLGIDKDNYGGHGDNYTPKINQIGAALGLPPVDKRRRKDKSLPISAHWPMCVRPAGYYGDLLKEPKQAAPEEPEDEPEDEPGPDWFGEAIQAFLKLTPDQHPAFFEVIGYPMPSPVTVNDDKPVETKPVETKTVIKPRKTRKVKSPPGCFSAQEISTIICLNTDITVLKDEFQDWVKNGLFPASDTTDKNGNIFWSQALAQTWFDAIPDGCRDSRTTSIKASSTTTF